MLVGDVMFNVISPDVNWKLSECFISLTNLKKECQAYAESGIQQNCLGHTEVLLLFVVLTCNQCAAMNVFLGKRQWRTGKSNSVPELNCCKFIIPSVLVSCRFFFSGIFVIFLIGLRGYHD